MATNAPVNEFHQYDIVAMEITNTFNPLIEQLIARRDALLTKLRTMREDYVTNETTRRAALEELERMIRHMREEGVKVNANLETQDKPIQVYLDQMEGHQTPTKLSHPFFSCETPCHLQTRISEFGEVREWEQDYSTKKKPALAVGKRGTGDNQLDATGLAIDEPNQLIYIADRMNRRILVVSYDGKFLRRFGQGTHGCPWGIVVTAASTSQTAVSMLCYSSASRTMS
eukprot:TRINITY_DN9513_c0_g1_i1.p1 TRINITY_DN9513_c0_g1~~TRINITY_DN9513_c0_g1_i1.p1  ORF type:complete len:228 (+),score=60.48 TRINITY_DN9513_c0_g1_i1:20-703(+)